MICLELCWRMCIPAKLDDKIKDKNFFGWGEKGKAKHWNALMSITAQ